MGLLGREREEFGSHDFAAILVAVVSSFQCCLAMVDVSTLHVKQSRWYVLPSALTNFLPSSSSHLPQSLVLDPAFSTEPLGDD